MVDVRGAIITVLRALFISSGEMITQGLVLLILLPIVGSSSIKNISNLLTKSILLLQICY